MFSFSTIKTHCVCQSSHMRLKVLFCKLCNFTPSEKEIIEYTSRWFFWLLLLLLLFCAKTLAMRWDFSEKAKKKKSHDNNWHRREQQWTRMQRKKIDGQSMWRRRWYNWSKKISCWCYLSIFMEHYWRRKKIFWFL